MRKASLVTGLDNVRCIYEIEGSGQKFDVRYPYTKKTVNIFPVSNSDLRASLEKMEIIFDGKITHKGVRTITTKLFDRLKNVQGGSDRVKLENSGIVSNYRITPEGLKLIAKEMMEDFAKLPNGDLAINECEENECLLKVII